MASAASLKITLDASAVNAAVDSAIERLQRAAAREEAARTDPLPVVVASAAAAAIGCAKPVSRRSFLGLRLW